MATSSSASPPTTQSAGTERASKTFVLTATTARQLVDRISRMHTEGKDFSLDLTKTRMEVSGARVVLANIEFFAKAKGLHVDGRNLIEERRFGERNIHFLTRLHNLAIGTATASSTGLAARIACAAHLFTAESQDSAVTLDDIRAYRAQAVFDFGPRDFDALFEMNDGSILRAALIGMARSDAGVARTCAEEMGWDEARQYLTAEAGSESGRDARFERDGR